jgi:hypothetical protein
VSGGCSAWACVCAIGVFRHSRGGTAVGTSPHTSGPHIPTSPNKTEARNAIIRLITAPTSLAEPWRTLFRFRTTTRRHGTACYHESTIESRFPTEPDGAEARNTIIRLITAHTLLAEPWRTLFRFRTTTRSSKHAREGTCAAHVFGKRHNASSKHARVGEHAPPVNP